MSHLFSPFTLRGVTLSNRIVISPMCQYSASNGEASDWHLLHLGHLALSGAAMLCLEATAVEAEGRITPGCLGLYSDATEHALRPVLAAIRKYSDIRVAVQLAHAGRKASCRVMWDGGGQIPPERGGWITSAPSARPYREGETTPAALDPARLRRVRDAFAAAATRAARLGIDGIEIHAAHGYLLHQFLSPLSNFRTDEYGGALENRMRFPLEVFEAVRAAFPADRPVGVRVSATDWVEGGAWDLPQTLVFVTELKKRGVDWIDVSSGGSSPTQQIAVGWNYQVPFAADIRKTTGVNTIAVGMINEAEQAEDIVASGKADLVAIARGVLYDARWPWHAAAKLGATVNAPPQYWRSQPAEFKSLFSSERPAGIRTSE